MAAFTTYCRFQSAPDQRIRNVWDNILQFQRLMAQLFIKADRGKDKNTSREQNGPSASRRGTQLWKGSTTAKSSACCCHVLATCQHSRQHQWGYPALSQVQARKKKYKETERACLEIQIERGTNCMFLMYQFWHLLLGCNNYLSNQYWRILSTESHNFYFLYCLDSSRDINSNTFGIPDKNKHLVCGFIPILILIGFRRHLVRESDL